MLAVAGGVGSVRVQLARIQGKRVIAAVGSEAKKRDTQTGSQCRHKLRRLGMQVRDATDGKGVSVVFDAVGRKVGSDALIALEVGGTGVIFGSSGGEPTMLVG